MYLRLWRHWLPQSKKFGEAAVMSVHIFRDDALRGKSILVTGGGSGLGKEISKALAAKGAQLHICGRRPQVLESAGEEIAAGAADSVRTHVCDIRDPEQ